MGLGPNNSSLLHKLGQKQAWEMTDDELHAIVAKDQHRRTVDRAIARLEKVLAEDDDSTYTPRRGRAKTKSTVKSSTARRKKSSKAEVGTLEGFGLSPDLIAKLRSTGKPDFQLILELQAAGVI